MESSVTAALGHVQTFVRPQVILTDDPSREDAFFVKALRSKVAEIGKSVIELPPDAAMNLMWVARLDSGSLAGAYTDLPFATAFECTKLDHSVAHDLRRYFNPCSSKLFRIAHKAVEIH